MGEVKERQNSWQRLSQSYRTLASAEMPFMLIQSAPRSGLSQDIIGYRFQMQSIQCNNMLDDGSVFVFFFGRTEDHGTINVDVRRQALTLGLWVQWPGGPVDLKTYWPPKKLTGPGGQ